MTVRSDGFVDKVGGTVGLKFQAITTDYDDEKQLVHFVRTVLQSF